MQSAEDARRDGNFDRERTHFDRAQEEAQSERERVEASYRRAHTWLRQNELKEGALALESLALTHPRSSRAARCWLDAGRAREALDQKDQAARNYRYLLQHYPSSGGASAAASRLVALQTKNASQSEVSRAWKRLLMNNTSPDLDESLRFQYARSLESLSLKEAIIAYEEVAKHHPLPMGNLSDDALLRASELRRSAGDPEGALLSLVPLLTQEQDAEFIGTYNRSSYVKALLLRGQILRDDLKDTSGARAAFNEFTHRYPRSRLLDDAHWELVRTSYQLGETERACQNMQRLKKQSPKSRFVPCEALLCSSGPELDAFRREKCEALLIHTQQ